jgi:hypothetical protein
MAAPKGKGTQKVRMLNGAVVKQVLYNGKSIGWGKYMAGEINGQLVVDEKGKPMYYAEIGQLELA